jgi:enoyl-[acyl-carrier protein] reductase II
MSTEVIREYSVPIVYADTYINLCEKKDLAMKYFKIWHELGSKIIVKASTVADAITAEEAGADVIFLKGWEGGGHVSYEATTILVPQAADAVSVPVVASGGIADGRGMAAAIALGAEAVEMGTIFMAASDAPVHPNVKEAVLACGDMDTVITGMSTGEPCRQIKNSLSDELLKIEAENVKAVAGPKVQEISMASLRKAMAEGDMEHGAVMAGQIAPLIKESKTVAQIIDDTIAQAKEILAQGVKFEF